ncbi:carbon dioxide-concentrating protein CcmK [Nostoc linckia z18]|uniref:Carboxysome shell protein CcmK n=2 Tax=Nostoc linckia TaxID=92942 RepID=A0A9Q5ZAN3_NOSLI|nr:carbon dioxide-concentrating mechanism protein CcmK [Nostoc linckia]PHK35704.1 carbon dioxide-concentrating protein CcmK [Nostoc linckia z15]PHK43240.1 carbon dioxide-concentrating protein CcmK [Nostoc linckia z16]PHJ68241.1 carbon dioxide-concentrating protein CcmK [Nostoc linckia z1]PHJ73678.1 carbon dioxide-concentrating protein CcmK [Nostoc linckia z3]PHJ78246.1 carbon dioxide-concentrating protein CcmK [Nostoc linckia z2]
MTLALGMIEVYGVPTAVEVGDAMCKAARVTLVGYENTDLGRITVLIRGVVGEVDVAITAGLKAALRVNGGEVLSQHIIPRPHENLEYVLPIYRSANVEQFSADIRFPPPLSV